MSTNPAAESAVEQAGPAVPLPADLADERLIQHAGLGGWWSAFVNRIRGGDLGSMPVVVGLILISLFFFLQQPKFLSSFSLVSLTRFAAPLGIISLGIVLVLLLGEIDLSVGSVSGLASVVTAVQLVRHDQSLIVALLAGIVTGVAIGALYSVLFVKLGVPSFVITLAGLLGFQGLLLYVLGSQGTLNLPTDSGLVKFASGYVSGPMSYVLAALVVVLFVGSRLVGIRRRTSAGLSAPSVLGLLVKGGALAIGLLFLTWYLQQGTGRGWSYLWILFTFLVVLMDVALRKTTWGRHVFAVGGNEEAARRAGIKVSRIYTSVFVLCSTLASIGGLLAAARLTSVSQSSGTGDTNLTAIAAAVIGGTSLFGGRGSAYSAMLGIIVLQAIITGLNLLGVDSSVRFMVTGAVLLLAVAIDSVARRARSSSGRG